MTLRRLVVGITVTGLGVTLAKGLQLWRLHQDRSPSVRPGDWPPVPSPGGGSRVGSGHGVDEFEGSLPGRRPVTDT